ncbi:helix-turn-helix domain-containing protein [Cerasicoccus arenae]|uniref:HTH cro/C1-type domain-containing protein n=1 Tax=Cerasicoccus arenae TaxID=424488 RepID=A0A8J3DD26_9BACT|nr:helix-turn-helix domain-containing protein [Cerasicoccus arenae]MBK1857773.1 helix-turn-helix domain-containing protein [Cerasicoccus arenae]GHC11972.1 hypothetical protein GCM10007047_31690 [Cerasicoccus arenae]
MKTKQELNLDIDEFFASARPLSDKELDDMARETRAIMDKPSFKSGVLKDQFIHYILETMDDEGITKSELAKRCGKTRQYLSKLLKEDKRVNYTVDTMVEVMHHLGRKVDINYPRNEEVTMVIHCLKVEPVRGAWVKSERAVEPKKQKFRASNSTPSLKSFRNEPAAA